MSQQSSAAPSAAPVASVVITSRNRKEDLFNAIASCLTQDVPIEIVVIDDASDDGTFEATRAKFPPERYPQVRLFRQETRVGLIVLRNRGARLAQTNFIFSIDDDAAFTTPSVVRQTLRDFENPRVGAVAIPFRNIRISNDLNQRAPDDVEVYAAPEYIGTAHALRKDIFLTLGGYRECLIHQGEESDYCIRLLDAGYIVRLGRSDAVNHFISPKRDMARIHFYGSRNNVLFIWYNVGLLRLPYYLAGTTAKTLIHGLGVKAFGIKFKAVLCAYGAGLRTWRIRRPVSAATWSLFRDLRGAPAPLSKIESRLPAPVPPAASPS